MNETTDVLRSVVEPEDIVEPIVVFSQHGNAVDMWVCGRWVACYATSPSIQVSRRTRNSSIHRESAERPG